MILEAVAYAVGSFTVGFVAGLFLVGLVFGEEPCE